MYETRKLRSGDSVVKRILAATWPDYAGRKVELLITDKVHLSSYTGEGGSWNEWKALELGEFRIADVECHGGLSAHVAGPGSLAWNTAFEATRMVPNIAYVGRIHFCGKDMGVRIVIHPDNAVKMLEAAI
jgi:hypothetical protein